MGMVIVFGGSFNPIHIGHEEIIESLSKLDGVDKVLVVPTKIPPHKDSSYLADETDRINMCSIIASKYPNVEVCDIELKREGKSYTIDTVTALKNHYKDKSLAITIGGDMLVSFDTWKDYKDILKKCSLITFKRVGINTEEHIKSVEKLIELGANIVSIENEITDVSSTQIRNDLAERKCCKLLDKGVFEYITKHNLYGV